jgi:hypothetical protein
MSFLNSVSLLAIQVGGFNVTTKTLAGWAFGVVIMSLALNVMMVMRSAGDERSKEERDSKIITAWLVFGSGMAVFFILASFGIITMSDVTSAASSF